MKLKHILQEAEFDKLDALFDAEFGKTLQAITNTVKSEKDALKASGEFVEEGQLSESMGVIGIIGVMLAIPRVIELLAKPMSKFIKLTRKILKPKAVTAEKEVAETIIHFAHKWHSAYVKIIKYILQISGVFKQAGFTTDTQKEKAANLVYYIIIAMLAVHAGLSSIHAFKELATAGVETGSISLAALETAMTSIKTKEVAEFVKKLIA